MSSISLKGVSKEYRDAQRTLRVLDNVNFDFPDSGTVSIVGRSGVGKSTLLHVLGGLDRPTHGNIVLAGQDLTALSADQLAALRGEKVGFIFQFHHLLPEFSALENVAMPLIIAGLDEQEALRRARDVLCRVGLLDRIDHRPGELSGGEQQRVAIARAIVSRPKLILADEPTGNLDAVTARLVQNLLLDIQKELGSLLVIVTHSAELASAMQVKLEMRPGGGLFPVGATSF